MPDQGPVFAETVRGDDLGAWSRVVAEAMHLQRELDGHQDEPSPPGCPRCRRLTLRPTCPRGSRPSVPCPRTMRDGSRPRTASGCEPCCPRSPAGWSRSTLWGCATTSCTTTCTPTTSSPRTVGCASSRLRRRRPGPSPGGSLHPPQRAPPPPRGHSRRRAPATGGRRRAGGVGRRRARHEPLRGALPAALRLARLARAESWLRVAATPPLRSARSSATPGRGGWRRSGTRHPSTRPPLEITASRRLWAWIGPGACCGRRLSYRVKGRISGRAASPRSQSSTVCTTQ